MEKKYEYRIVLFENGKQKKIVKRGRSYEDILSEYEKLLKKSSKVVFPQNYTNKEKNLISIKHELCFVSNDPKIRQYRGFNDLVINLKEKGFKVNKLQNYHIEEKFYCYPEQRQKNYNEIKKEISQINGLITCYQINNKIIFETIRDIEYMVVCKSVDDANILYNIFENDKKLILMCVGKMSQLTMKRRSEKIMKRFNMSYKRFHINKTKA